MRGEAAVMRGKALAPCWWPGQGIALWETEWQCSGTTSDGSLLPDPLPSEPPEAKGWCEAGVHLAGIPANRSNWRGYPNTQLKGGAHSHLHSSCPSALPVQKGQSDGQNTGQYQLKTSGGIEVCFDAGPQWLCGTPPPPTPSTVSLAL